MLPNVLRSFRLTNVLRLTIAILAPTYRIYDHLRIVVERVELDHIELILIILHTDVSKELGILQDSWGEVLLLYRLANT